MSRRRIRRTPSVAGDFGPRRGKAARPTEVVDAADPDIPTRTIRRARLADPVARMRQRGEITQSALEAAEAFRELAEAAQYPSRSSLGALGQPGGAYGGGALPPASVARSAAILAQVWACLWPYTAAIEWVVLDRRSLDDFADERHVRRAFARQWFGDALVRLEACLPGGGSIPNSRRFD